MWEASRPRPLVSSSLATSPGEAVDHILLIGPWGGPFGKIGDHYCQGVDFGGRSTSGLPFQGKGEKALNSGSCSPFFWKDPRKSGAVGGAQQFFTEATFPLLVITAFVSPPHPKKKTTPGISESL